MKYAQISGILIALTLSGALPVLAQPAPHGYLALDQYAGAAIETPKAPAPFTVARGASLRTTLEDWARIAGWQPIAWGLPDATDFTLGADGSFDGDVITATRSLLNALGAEADLKVRFNRGNKLMVVEAMQ